MDDPTACCWRVAKGYHTFTKGDLMNSDVWAAVEERMMELPAVVMTPPMEARDFSPKDVEIFGLRDSGKLIVANGIEPYSVKNAVVLHQTTLFASIHQQVAAVIIPIGSYSHFLDGLKIVAAIRDVLLDSCPGLPVIMGDLDWYAYPKRLLTGELWDKGDLLRLAIGKRGEDHEYQLCVSQRDERGVSVVSRQNFACWRHGEEQVETQVRKLQEGGFSKSHALIEYPGITPNLPEIEGLRYLVKGQGALHNFPRQKKSYCKRPDATFLVNARELYRPGAANYAEQAREALARILDQ